MNDPISFLIPLAIVAVAAIPLILQVVPPNRLYGVRTRRTLANREVWFRVNRFAGWAMLVATAVSTCVFIAFPDLASGGSFAGLLVFVVPLVIALLAIQLVAILRSPARRRNPALLWPTAVSVPLVLAQAGLGAVVVATDLDPTLVTIHFATAMALVASVVLAAVNARYLDDPEHRPAERGADRGFTAAAGIAAAATLLLLLIGTFVRASNSGLAFTDWPLMDGKLFPTPFDGPAATMFAHRLAALLEKDDLSGCAPLVRNVSNSLEDVESLLGTLVDISKLDAGVIKPDIAPFAVSELLENLAAEYHQIAGSEGLRLDYLPSSALVRSDVQLLARILRNFLSNAIRYTASGRILLGCRRRGNSLSIEVWDSGIGIAPDKLGEIFQEFKRGDTVQQMLDSPFYHPVIEEGVRTALRDLQRRLALPATVPERCLDCVTSP